MLDTIGFRSQADFAAARTKAFFRDILALLTGQPNRLMEFDKVSQKLHIGGPIYRGVHAVSVDRIIGSMQRYQDFDRAFLPAQSHTASRWTRVNRAWYEDLNLPPVLLYKVGEVYFVVDGHHRVSVAREQGADFIDAEVRECQVKVTVTADLQPEDLELLGAQVEFLERTHLDQLRPQTPIQVTILGGYERMLEHIAVHLYFMGLDLQRDISDAEAVEHWHDTVYQRVIDIIRQSDLMKAFPSRTEADFYLWVMDRQHYLIAHSQADWVEPGQAAAEFVAHFKMK